MDNNQLNKKHDDVRDSQKKDYHPIPTSPALMEHFQRQSIALQNNQANHYSLIFNATQQPSITHYLIEGTPVALLTQINNEINFTTSKDKICHFSLQIPYQAGVLTINTKGEFIFEKRIDTYSTHIIGKTVDFSDDFFTQEGVTVHAEGCKSHAQLACSNFVFKGKSFETMLKSSLQLRNSLTLAAECLILNEGIIDCKKKSLIESALFKNAGTFTSDNMHFEGKAITNEGTILINEHLSAHARSISNAGHIKTKSSDIKADRYFYNKIFSSFSAENNLTINTPLALNFLALTRAQNLNVNSGLGFNALGIYSANNTNVNALFSLNAGLLIPGFISNFNELYSLKNKVFTLNNAFVLGESLFIKHIPVLGTVYAALKHISGMYQQGKTIYKEGTSLYKQKNRSASDIIAFLCLVKSMTISFKKTENIQQSYRLLSNLSQANKIQIPTTLPALSSLETQAKNILPGLPTTLMSLYGPSVNCDSIVNLNSGLAIGINNSSSSLLEQNLGISLYANNTIGTCFGKSSGIIGAYNLNVKARNFYDLGGITEVSSGNINAYSLDINGPVNARDHFKTQGTYADIKGNVSAPKIDVDADCGLMISSSSHLVSSDIYLQSDLINQKGIITAERNAILKGYSVTNAGTIEAQKIIIPESEINYYFWFRGPTGFINKGILRTSEQLYTDTRKVTLEETSHISSPKAYFKSDSSWENKGQLNAEQCLIESEDQALNNGTINVSDTFDIKAQNIIFQQESNVKAKDATYTAGRNVVINGLTDIERGSVKAGRNVTAIGKLGASSRLDINAANITFQKKSDISAGKSELNATETIENQGTLTTPDLYAHAKYVINSGEIKVSDKAHIKADRYFWNQCFASINAENNLTIDALILLNTFGWISADSLSTNSIVDANLLGICKGNTISQNSFVSWNKGLLIPKFNSLKNLGDVIKKNPLKFAENFILPLVPQVGKIYSLSKSVAMCFSNDEKTQKASLWGRAVTLKEQIETLSQKKDLCVSDVVPTLCQTKNIVATAIQTGSQIADVGQQIYQEAPQILQLGQQLYDKGKQTYQEGTQAYQEGKLLDVVEQQVSQAKQQATTQMSSVAQQICEEKNLACHATQNYFSGKSDTTENSTQEQKTDNENAMPIASTALSFALSAIQTGALTVISIAGPQLSRNSLIDLNDGLMIGVNGNSESLYNTNSGASFFANSYSVNTMSGSNTGFMGGGNISVNASKSYESSGITAGTNVAITANDLAVTGNTYALNTASLKAHNNASIDAKISAGHVAVNAENLDLQNNSHIDANTASITAQSILGESENTISSVHGAQIKTKEIDNQGTINGPTTLDFTGDISQLKSIGSVDQLTYKGTLENNLADTLANGHSTLLNVKEGGAVTICAEQQDVHLKEEHNLTHAFYVETKGAITCDNDLLSEKTIWLQAEGDVNHAAVKSQETTGLIGKNISSAGHITREQEGENYKDTCQESIVTGKQVIIKAEENLEYKATHVHYGVGGTQVYVGKNLIADALEVQEYTKSEDIRYGTWQTKTVKDITAIDDHKTTAAPCTFSSEGVTQIVAGNAAELHATVFDSKGGTAIQAPSIIEVPTYDTHIHTEEINTLSFVNKGVATKKSISIQERPVDFNNLAPVHLITENPISIHLKSNASSITIDAPAIEILLTKQATETTSHRDHRKLNLVDKGDNVKALDITTQEPYSGTINTNAEKINIEHTAKNAPPTINATNPNATITYTLLDDVHEYKKESYIRPTPALKTIIALSLSMALNSMGSPLVGAAVGKLPISSPFISAAVRQASVGAMNGLCNEALNILCDCDGDIKKAAQELASTKTMRKIAKTTALSVATGVTGQILDKYIPSPSEATTFAERVAYTVPRELTHEAIKCTGDIAQGKNAKEALKEHAKEALANTIGIAGSGEIGKAYSQSKIDPITHKLLHAALGAAQGAIINGKDGAIAAAIGAAAAETVADILSPLAPSIDSMQQFESELGRPSTYDEFGREWNRQTIEYLKQAHSVGERSKIIAATVATLTNQDVDIAYNTATKAVNNNFIALINYGIFATDVGWALCQVPQVYKEHGIEKALQYLGVEVAWASKDLVLGRLTDVLTFKFCNKLYPSASLAINAVLDKTPGLKHVLGNFMETLVASGEKLASTGLGKRVGKIFQYTNCLETKILDIEKNSLGKVVNKAENLVKNVAKQINPSLAGDLVESVIPGSVINHVEKQAVKKATKASAKQLSTTTPHANAVVPAQKISSNEAIVKQTKRDLSKRPLATNKGKKTLTESKPKATKKGNNTAEKQSLAAEKTPLKDEAQTINNAPQDITKSPSVTAKTPKKTTKSLTPRAPKKVLSSPKSTTSDVIKKDSVLNQDVSLSLREIAQQEITKAKNQLRMLEKNVEEFSKTVSHDHVGELLNMSTDCTKFEKIELETKKFYDFIRSTNEDINAIAKSTGIKKEIITQIKNHVFIEEHILREGIMRFYPDEDMSAAWKRLMEGNFLYSDLVLLQHEYAESFGMQGTKIPYDIVHPLINEIYNWEKSYK